ncbi:MAG TPA: dTMP kinase [Kiritimatiellia bacterium]|nr:dTMP kinase [Kiritimatiellia bacterium]
MSAGKFITLEGPEGGGKTTQAKRLIQRMTRQGLKVIYTREPGGTSTGELIRSILQHDRSKETIHPETEVFLFAASRSQLVRQVILPALEAGTHVVCDRYADSTTVYQGYGRGFDVEQMIAINSLAIGPAIPDLTLLLDVTVELGFARLAERQRELFEKPDRIEREARAFHERVRAGYLDLAKRWPERFQVLDGGREEDVLEEDIWGRVSGVLA